MRADEIVNIPSRDDPIEKYNSYFDNANRITTPLYNLEYAKVVNDNTEYYGLFLELNLMAILVLTSDRLGVPQIMCSQTEPDFRGKGLLRYLFNKALEIHSEIYSDDHHTPESKHFWKNIANYPQPNFTTFVYDTGTEQYHKFDLKNSDKIWNNQINPILMARRTTYTTEEIDRQKKSNNAREKHGRGDFDIWYGKYTPHNGYSNP